MAQGVRAATATTRMSRAVVVHRAGKRVVIGGMATARAVKASRRRHAVAVDVAGAMRRARAVRFDCVACVNENGRECGRFSDC